MIVVDRETFARLHALASHPSAWFTINDLVAWMKQSEQDIEGFVSLVQLQLDVMAAFSTFFAARGNAQETYPVMAATAGYTLARLSSQHPVEGQEAGQIVVNQCAQVFTASCQVSWKPVQWVKQPSVEVPHSVN
jgi:hypothetical protein